MKTQIEGLRQLKSLQAANCRKTKPWLKSTGPRTIEGKRRATQNLPNQAGGTSKVLRNLEKLQVVLAKLQKREEKTKKRQQSAFVKLEKLAKESNG